MHLNYLNSDNRGCACLGGEVVIPLGGWLKKKKPSLSSSSIRRYCCAVGAAVRRAVNNVVAGAVSFVMRLTSLRDGPWRGKHKGAVPGLGIGCLSAGFNCVRERSSRAVVRYPTWVIAGRYDDNSPKEALGMFRSRARRLCGHAAIFAWSDLILDHNRKLVGLQSPAACDSGPYFENKDLFHAQSPDTERGVHSCSWRTNREVCIRR